MGVMWRTLALIDEVVDGFMKCSVDGTWAHKCTHFRY